MRRSLGSVDKSVLAALRRARTATVAEIAAMLPNQSPADVEAARNRLIEAKLVEPATETGTTALRLTAAGATLAAKVPDAESAGSGGGEAGFE